jgi:hypothetical protein
VKNDDASYAPAKRWEAVTPHAADPLPSGVADYLYVGGAGAVAFRPAGSPADITRTFPAGAYVWCEVSHVRVSGTTATEITACYTKRA